MLTLLKKTLKFLAGALLALLLLFEEWGWIPLSNLLGKLARLPLWARMEHLIARLPPYAAMLLFAVPVLLLLPVKLLALHWLALGQVKQALAVLVAAKLAGTAVVARIFQLVQPALMQIGWFAHWYPRWSAWKSAWFAAIRASRPWRMGQVLKRRSQRWWSQWMTR